MLSYLAFHEIFNTIYGIEDFMTHGKNIIGTWGMCALCMVSLIDFKFNRCMGIVMCSHKFQLTSVKLCTYKKYSSQLRFKVQRYLRNLHENNRIFCRPIINFECS